MGTPWPGPFGRIALVTLALGVIVPPARAQLCAAAPSLKMNGWRAGVGGATAQNLRWLTATGAAGSRTSGIWGGAGVGFMRVQDLDRTALTASANLGLEAPLDTARSSGLCPFVRGGTQTGPRDIGGTGVNYSDFDLGVGLSVGRALTRWDDGMIATAIEASYLRTFYRYKGPAGTRSGYNDTKAVTVSLGVTTGRVLLRLSVAQPVFTDGAVISYGASLSLLGLPPIASQLSRTPAP